MPKRRNPEQLTPPNTSLHVSKKQKRSHPSESLFPPAFWDNLSKVDLTRRALEELHRRNSHPPYGRPARPLTRRVRAELRSVRPAQPAASYLCHCGSRTLKNIKRFARHGGPDLSDLRGFPEPIDPLHHKMSSGQSVSRIRKCGLSSTNTRSTPNTTTAKSTGPYNRNFQQNLIDGGIYPDEYEYPDGRVPPQPNNWEDINQRLAQSRPSLSPLKFPDEEFRKFKRANANAFKEKQVTTSVIPIIEGDIGDAKCISGGIPFTNLDHLTDGTLVPGNPDIYYGIRPEQLDRRVRDNLSDHIVPSTQDDLPIAPNFFLTAKGPDGSAAVAKRQACYDGALGARGIHRLQSYGKDEPVYDNNAHTITSIYSDGQLKIYTSHPVQPTSPGGRPEYYIHQLNAWSMTGNIETFRQGAAAYRNARDWAKEQRDNAINRANGRARDGQAEGEEVSSSAGEVTEDEPSANEVLSQESQPLQNGDPSTISNLEDSESSTDEVLNYRFPVERSSKRLKQSRESQRKRPSADNSTNDL